MHKNLFITTALLTTCFAGNLFSREVITLRDNWRFRFSHQVQHNSERKVTLPHTWNDKDALSGKIDYKRGIGNYRLSLKGKPEWKGKRLFLKFNGANAVTDVFFNGKFQKEHRGGYTAFEVEITKGFNFNGNNEILVRVNNAEQFDVMPLVGDFNFYGGLYRDVELIITDEIRFASLSDDGSSGLYLTQIAPDTLRVDVELSNPKAISNQVVLQLGDLPPVTISVVDKGSTTIKVENPKLWSPDSPTLYKLTAKVGSDELETAWGFRTFSVDPNTGVKLNGESIRLRGVNRHQEREGKGNALSMEDHEEDFRLIKEMGANAVRLAHYPQADEVYSICDRLGLIVWAEIPFIGPGGYADKGFVDSPGFKENGKTQLRELIRQNVNHPSICMWGLFNELKEQGDNPCSYVTELNKLSHELDGSRPTVAASNQGGRLNTLTDLIAWNRYDGWYGSTPNTLAGFLDRTHKDRPKACIGISEYGAGASIKHQQDNIKQPAPAGKWHPENWQTFYHIENWKIINSRPFVWGSFVWNMFDFGAAHRTEGDRDGINDKGLITHDRKTKKDSFFFYKANWNPEPMLHLAAKRHTERKQKEMKVLAFGNIGTAELFINNVSQGVKTPDNVACYTWDVVLTKGANTIKVVSTQKPEISDSYTCTLK